MIRRLSPVFALLFVLSVLATACGSGASGGPSSPGTYDVQKNSIRFDGERYELFWADQSGHLHEMQTRKLRLVRDPDRTYLEVPNGGGDPIMHLREDEPITVEGQDHQGSFTSSWFPFFLGAALGSQFGGNRGGTVIINQPAPGERGSYDASTPAYRYPPTGTFGREDDLHGTLDSSKPQAPDYNKVQPQPYATSGKSSGTGGGTAATNKSVGPSSGAGNATSGLSGGTGSGSAASDKGGFKSGEQSYTSKSSGTSGGLGAGETTGKPSTGVTGSKSGGGSGGGSKGLGGARVGGRR
jgi:hypothetical protein